MAKPAYNPDNKEVLDSLLLNRSGVRPGKMFGYPAYYINHKMFACLYENGVGLKVPEPAATEFLKRDGITPFQPLGRKKMREWIQIDHEIPGDYHEDKEIFELSMEYVRSLKSGK